MLYVFNSNTFTNDHYLLLIPVIIAVTILGIGAVFNILGTRLFKNYQKFNNLFQAFLASIGLIVFFNDLIIPTQASALNGVVKAIPEPVLMTILELIIAITIYTFLLINFNNSKVKKLLISICSYSIALVFALGLFVIYFGASKNIDLSTIKKNIANQNKESPNVYFLWLDEMQVDYFIKAITEDKQKNNFNNFTLYKNNISNYLYTFQSYHSFMSGTIFDGGDYKEWLSDDRMRREFKSRNYNLTSYGMPEYISELDSNVLKTGDAVKELLVMKHPYFNDFNSLSLVRMSPNFLANESLLLGTRLSDAFTSYFYPNQRHKEQVNTIAMGMEPYSATVTYKHLIADEHSRQDKGEFVLAQIILPHGPIVMNKDCQYYPPTKPLNRQVASKKYLGQAKCAIKLVISFINTLKQLNRYDDSIIVVMSDHGHGRTDLMENYKIGKTKLNSKYSSWNEQQVLKRASALLMIKPVGSSKFQNLQISDIETQHVDIVPSLFSLLNWKTNYQFDGRDILSYNNEKRNSILTYFKSNKFPDFDDAEVYHVNYDSVLGRTRLKLIDTFNKYFSSSQEYPLTKWLEVGKAKNNAKKNKKKPKAKNLIDQVNMNNFEKK